MYSERRRTVRQKVPGPAFAIFDGVTGGMILDLSHEGMAMQCPNPGPELAPSSSQPMKMRLELTDPELLVETTGYIAWADALGRAGVRFSDLPDEPRRRLDEWLTENAATPSRKAPKLTLNGYGNTGRGTLPSVDPIAVTLEPVFSASSPPGSMTVQYEFTSLSPDLNSALRVIANRAMSLTRGSGAAIALAHKTTMICRASVGACAPALGTRLDSGSRFSAECIRRGQPLRCDDAQNHLWIDEERAREFSLRSIVAAPVQYERNVIGLLEVFSTEAFAFDDGDLAVVERLARTVLLSLCEASPRGTHDGLVG